MDITLIPQADSKYDKKLHKSFISDNGIVQLTDCSLVLLHKAGMRPLYLMTGKEERIIIQPEHKKMAEPDLILFSDTGVAGEQSAKVIQEQLKTCSCSAEIRGLNLSMWKWNKKKNFDVLKNMLTTRVQQLEEKGYHHIVVVGDAPHLDTIARCMNGTGLNQAYNIPIYSFSDGKEIQDRNLIDNFYITRELLDDLLMSSLNRDIIEELVPFKNKCHHSMELYLLKKKLRSKE